MFRTYLCGIYEDLLFSFPSQSPIACLLPIHSTIVSRIPVLIKFPLYFSLFVIRSLLSAETRFLSENTFLQPFILPHSMQPWVAGLLLKTTSIPQCYFHYSFSMVKIHCFKAYVFWLYASYLSSLLTLILFWIKSPSFFKDFSTKLHVRPIHHLGLLISLDLFYFSNLHFPAMATVDLVITKDCSIVEILMPASHFSSFNLLSFQLSHFFIPITPIYYACSSSTAEINCFSPQTQESHIFCQYP